MKCQKNFVKPKKDIKRQKMEILKAKKKMWIFYQNKRDKNCSKVNSSMFLKKMKMCSTFFNKMFTFLLFSLYAVGSGTCLLFTDDWLQDYQARWRWARWLWEIHCPSSRWARGQQWPQAILERFAHYTCPWNWIWHQEGKLPHRLIYAQILINIFSSPHLLHF